MEWKNNYVMGDKRLTLSDLYSSICEIFSQDIPLRLKTFYGINHIIYGSGCRNLSQLQKAKMNASKTANILKEFQGWKPKVERKKII